MKLTRLFYKIAGIALLAIVVSGCETTNSIQYTPSTNNVIQIKDRWGESDIRVKLNEFTGTGIGSMICRAAGAIDPTPGKTVTEYVRSAFQDELFMAGIYSNNGEVVIDGNIDELSFRSFGGGRWDITMTLSSNMDQGYQVSTSYEFPTSWSAYFACQNVANAFNPAIQNLLNKVVTHPQFSALIGHRPD
uniref:Lipoprotein n=1 Tax=Candidatus Kentrum sp. DK TaxID=2126562 RepID=A0A450TP06_9GAMM|nr:MAG: hypothetical protein BECKDK2373B_GA0170837_12482 [Candidatus Kentron sp. DK]